MKKRILSLMLAVMMVCTSVPADFMPVEKPFVTEVSATDTMTGNFTIDASGVVSGYSDTAAKEIVIPEVINGTTVTAIAEKAFDGSKYSNLKSIAIAGKDVKIGTDAFGFSNGARVDGFTIWGKRGSTAESYALAKAITFSIMTSTASTLTSTQTDLSCCYIGGSPIYVSTVIDAAEKGLTEEQLPKDVVWSSEDSNSVTVSQYSWEQNTDGQWVCTAQVRVVAAAKDKKTCKLYFDTKTIHQELELTLAKAATEVNLGMQVYGYVQQLDDAGNIHKSLMPISLPDTAIEGNNFYVDCGQYVAFTAHSDSIEDPSFVTTDSSSRVLGTLTGLTLDSGEIVTAYPVNEKGILKISVLTKSGQVSKACNLIALSPASEIVIMVDGVETSSLCSVIQGYTGMIEASLTPADSTDTVTWSSSNEKVIGISSDGTITSTEYGSAVVTCTINADKTGKRLGADGEPLSKSITFIVAEKFKYNEMSFIKSPADKQVITSLDIAAGTSQQLTVYDMTATDVNKMPNEPVTWESSDSNIVAVDSDGRITASRNVNGSVKITARSESGIMATLDVSVYVEATKITLESNAYQIPQGQKLVVPYMITPSNTGEIVNWISDDPASVKVISAEKDANENGKYFLTLEVLKVTDKFININGKTNASGVTAQVQVKGLKAIHAESIKMSPSSYVRIEKDEKGNSIYCVEKGENFTITAEVTPTDCNDILSWEYLAANNVEVDKIVGATAKGNLATFVTWDVGTVEVRCVASGGITGVCFIKIIQSATSVNIANSSDYMIEKVQVTAEEDVLLKSILSYGSTDSVKWIIDGSTEIVGNDEVKTDKFIATKSGLNLTTKFLMPGTYKVRAVADSGKFAEVTVVVVIPTASIEFEEKVGDAYAKIDTLVMCQNQTRTVRLNKILPENTSDKIYNWEEIYGNLKIKVSEDTKTAEITALTPGITYIRVSAESGKVFELNVTVLVPATSIQIGGKETPEDVVLNKGSMDVTITATLGPDNTDDRLTWSTDKDGIIKVEPYGMTSGSTQMVLVSGLESGEVLLTAESLSGIKRTVRIIVKTQDIANCEGIVSDQVYIGTELKPELNSVYLNSQYLTLGTDYEITGYANNINAGTATISLKGIGNYSGIANVSFNILPKGLDSTVEVQYQKEFVYNQKDIRPTVVVKDAGTVLVKGTDYDIVYPDTSKVVGSYYFDIVFKRNIQGTRTETFTVVEKSAKSFTIKNSANKVVSTLSSKSYTGSAQTQKFYVYDGTKKLTEDTDYTVEYTDNVDAGVATITIRGRGNYSYDTVKTIRFRIKPYSLKNVNISKISDLVYTGAKLLPDVTVRRQINKSWNYLTLGSDYKVSYSNNINTGKATVKITAGTNGNYADSKTINFKILPTEVTDVVQTSASTKSVKLSWAKNKGAVSGYAVYKVQNGKYTYLKSTSTNSIVLSGLKPGSNYEYAVRAYKKVGTKTKYTSTTYSYPVMAMTLPNTPSIRLSSSNLAVNVKWSSAKGADGYYVYYSDKGSKGPYKNAGYITTPNYLIDAGFKKGKTVYVKMRPVRMINGKECFGSYSAVKKIKVK